jgi:hypothetical protein
VPIFLSLKFAGNVPHAGSHYERIDATTVSVDLMARDPSALQGIQSRIYMVDSEGWEPHDAERNTALGRPMRYWHPAGNTTVIGSGLVSFEDLNHPIRQVQDPGTEHYPTK